MVFGERIDKKCVNKICTWELMKSVSIKFVYEEKCFTKLKVLVRKRSVL